LQAQKNVGRGTVWQARDRPADILLPESEVRRSGRQLCATAAATGRREPEAEAIGGRAGAGHRRLQDGAVKKVVGPHAEREALKVFGEATKGSEHRTCGQMEIVRAMVCHQPRASRFALSTRCCVSGCGRCLKICGGGDCVAPMTLVISWHSFRCLRTRPWC